MILLATILFSLVAQSKSKVEVTYLCDDGSVPSESGCCGLDETCPTNCNFYTISNESGRRECSCTQCTRSSPSGGSSGGSSPYSDTGSSDYQGGSGTAPSGGGGPTRRPPRSGPGGRRPIKPFHIPNCEKVMGFAACQAATDFRGRRCSWEAGDHKCNEARPLPPMFQPPSYNGYPLDKIVDGVLDVIPGHNSHGGQSYGVFDSPDSHSWSPFQPYGQAAYPFYGGSGHMLQFSREQLVEDFIATCNALDAYECVEWSTVCQLDQATNMCLSHPDHFPEAVRTAPAKRLQSTHHQAAKPAEMTTSDPSSGIRILPLVLIFLASFSVTAGVAYIAASQSWKSSLPRGGKLIENC